jgi:hypothetical protein
MADFLALRSPAIEAEDAASAPWTVFHADTGFVGRAADLVKAARLSGAVTDGVPRRLHNTVTKETLEWTRGGGWLTTQRALRAPKREPVPPPAADPDSPLYRKDIYG